MNSRSDWLSEISNERAAPHPTSSCPSSLMLGSRLLFAVLSEKTAALHEFQELVSDYNCTGLKVEENRGYLGWRDWRLVDQPQTSTSGPPFYRQPFVLTGEMVAGVVRRLGSSQYSSRNHRGLTGLIFPIVHVYAALKQSDLHLLFHR